MKLMEQLKQTLKREQYLSKTFKAYRAWVETFLRFHKEVAGSWRHSYKIVLQQFSLYFAG